MKFKIYHKNEMRFGFDVPESFNKSDYTLVAEVESENLGDTFRITNHIEHDWTTNPEVIKMHKTGGCRSTSVGDIVEDENGKFHYCAGCGWEDIKRSD